MGGLFYRLGKMAGPKIRKGKWLWQSVTGTQEEAIRAEYEVGCDLAAEIRLQVSADPDSGNRQLVDEIGRKLTGHLSNKLRRFTFETFQAPEPNAFALPGGFIFVTVPLLELCNRDRDEIAFVLAHEMAHVIKGHAMERIVSDSAINIASKASVVRGPLSQWVRRVGIQFLESTYSQDRELDADSLGAELIDASGYDRGAPARLLGRLAKLAENSGPEHPIGKYFSSHPSANVRINTVNRILCP